MPNETQDAVGWSLQQTYVDGFGREIPILKSDISLVVDKVRQYFNIHHIEYEAFSYDDLIIYL